MTTDSRVRHDRGRRGSVYVVSRCGISRQVRSVRLTHVGVRRGRLSMMRLEGRQCMRLGDLILGLHRVLRHRHAGDGGR
jgi:hypothetical protein